MVMGFGRRHLANDLIGKATGAQIRPLLMGDHQRHGGWRSWLGAGSRPDDSRRSAQAIHDLLLSSRLSEKRAEIIVRLNHHGLPLHRFPSACGRHTAILTRYGSPSDRKDAQIVAAPCGLARQRTRGIAPSSQRRTDSPRHRGPVIAQRHPAWFATSHLKMSAKKGFGLKQLARKWLLFQALERTDWRSMVRFFCSNNLVFHSDKPQGFQPTHASTHILDVDTCEQWRTGFALDPVPASSPGALRQATSRRGQRGITVSSGREVCIPVRRVEQRGDSIDDVEGELG